MKKTNSKRFIVIAFGLLLVLTQSALAQSGTGTGTITGHVKDPQGAHLTSARVRLYGRERTFSLTTTTNSTGTYRFDRLAPGEYLVEAEAEGFASASAKQVSVERGQEATLDIPLELSGVRSTVVVTASDTPQSVDEVSKAVTVVDLRVSWTIACRSRGRFALSFSVFDSRCSRLHLAHHSRVLLFRHRQRPTPEMDPLPTCSGPQGPSCGRTWVMAIERRRFLNALAPFSTAPLVLGLSVIRA
jgi:hypothetical protein